MQPNVYGNLVQLYFNCFRDNKFRAIFGALLLLAGFTASGQQVNGTVVDAESNIAPSATVYLIKAADSAVVKVALTNENGAFTFAPIKPGSYLISISFLGLKAVIPPFTLQSGGIDLKVIKLQKRSSLGMVTIASKTPLIEVKPGKTIINVSKSLLSAGGNALDVLSATPGVQVDAAGSVTLKGKDVTVTINNKETHLSADALAEVLRNTPAGTIDKVELISNPNAGYSAEGTGGIINIKLIRNTALGFNSSANASYGYIDVNPQYGSRRKGGLGFNFDYNAAGISIFGGFARTDNASQRLSDIDRLVFLPAPQYVHTTFLNDLNDRGYNMRLGMDVKLNPKNTLGFYITSIYSNYDYTKTTTSAITNNIAVDSIIKSLSATKRKLLTYTTNINYKGDWGKAGSFTADADYSLYDRYPVENSVSSFFYPNYSQYREQAYQYVFPTLYHIVTFAARHEIKTGKASNISTQLKTSFVKTGNKANFYNVARYMYQPDARFTNAFGFTEQINALGINFNTPLSKKTTLTAGLRAEQTVNNGVANNSSGTETQTKNNYTDVFPSVQVLYNLGNNQLEASAGRRIRRPTYIELNPFVNYQDQYNYYVGNPQLKPQYTNSIEATEVYKQKLSITLSASRTDDYTFLINLPGNIVSQRVNFGDSYNYGIQLNKTADITRWWNANLNIDAELQHFDNSLGGNNYAVTAQDVSVNLRQQFSFLKDYHAELLGMYESAHNFGFYKVEGMYHIDAAVSRSLFNKKGTIQLQVFDVFNTNFTVYNTTYQSLNFNGRAQFAFRTIQLSLNYAFGSRSQAERAHKISSGDEQSRAGG